jgi:hypothetical protein
MEILPSSLATSRSCGAATSPGRWVRAASVSESASDPALGPTISEDCLEAARGPLEGHCRSEPSGAGTAGIYRTMVLDSRAAPRATREVFFPGVGVLAHAHHRAGGRRKARPDR